MLATSRIVSAASGASKEDLGTVTTIAATGAAFAACYTLLSRRGSRQARAPAATKKTRAAFCFAVENRLPSWASLALSLCARSLYGVEGRVV